MEQERRRHARYSQSDLELEVARPGIKGILSVNPSAECLDFSLTGLQFGSDQPFRQGEKVIVDLRVYDLRADELRASVVSSEKKDNGMWCTRLRFCFEDKSMQKPEISHSLLKIEDRLRIATEFPMSSPGRGPGLIAAAHCDNS